MDGKWDGKLPEGNCVRLRLSLSRQVDGSKLDVGWMGDVIDSERRNGCEGNCYLMLKNRTPRVCDAARERANDR